MKILSSFLTFALLLLIIISCNDECRNYVETPCQSAKTTGPRSYVGQVLEQVSDGNYVGIPNCSVVDTGWAWNDTQCGATECPFFDTTSTDSQGYFSFTDRPTFVNDPIVIVRKQGFKVAKQVINADSLRIVMEPL